ncbi:MAG: Trypsin-2 precursor [Labilithrix sp.]|nr:Trypsin-2 precursor [Labilithrix sp.]
MRPRALLPLLFVLSACGSEITERAGATSTRRVSQGIVNGTPDSAANNAVVYIGIGNQGSFCTGTLIAPNLVLTAHHCVADPNENVECGAFGSPMSPASFSISVGLQPGGKVATGSKVVVDTAKPNNMCGNDIALIQLDRDIPNAPISKVRLTKLTAGETASTSGYGDDGSGNVTNGRYVKTGIKVDAVGPTTYAYKTKAGQSLPVTLPAGEIVTGESTCFGDSGGPLFDAAGNVIGMTSRGIDEKCIDRPSIYTDTASHAEAIKAAALAAGHPLQEANPLPGEKPAPGTSPQSDPTKDDTTGDTAGDSDTSSASDTEDGDEPVIAPNKKTKKTSLGTPAAASCSASPMAPRSSSSFACLGLAGLALAMRLRSRLRAPASR